ncbi:MAG: hypothetical protein HPY59_04635 [Anaerolineae bacterium]|nr:hypothetical protein [Anaerolineae bacterium]
MFSQLSLPLSNKIFTAIDRHAATCQLLMLTAVICCTQRVTLLDCGNRSDMYAVARHLRLLTHDPVTALKRIRVSRAFTCYQVVAMLTETTIAPGEPVILPDFLSTFFDDEVKIPDASRLFQKSLMKLKSISETSPVLVTARPVPSQASGKAFLLNRLIQASHVVFESRAVLEPPGDLQMPLFAES